MLRAQSLAAALLIAAVPLGAFNPNVPAANPDPSEITRTSIVASMNVCRAQRGLAPLHEDARLDAAAEDRIHDMEDLGYWGHTAPDGRSPFVWLQPEGYTFQSAGENLAAGFDTTEMLVGAWMDSKGHRDNILSQSFADCGIAIIDGATTGPAEGKSIVVIFGHAR